MDLYGSDSGLIVIFPHFRSRSTQLFWWLPLLTVYYQPMVGLPPTTEAGAVRNDGTPAAPLAPGRPGGPSFGRNAGRATGGFADLFLKRGQRIT